MNVPFLKGGGAYLHVIDDLGEAAKLVPRARLDVNVAIARLCGERGKRYFQCHAVLIVKADTRGFYGPDRDAPGGQSPYGII